MKPEPLFETRKTNPGHKESIIRAVEDGFYINNWLKPHGLSMRTLASKDDILKMRSPSLALIWSDLYERLLATHGILSIIETPNNKGKIIVQPTLRNNIVEVKKYYYPMWNISQTFVNVTSKGNRLKRLREVLSGLNIYYFIMTRTKRWWIGKYEDIPIYQLQLTYRSKNKELDRMMVTNQWHDENHPITNEQEIIECLHNIINNENK